MLGGVVGVLLGVALAAILITRPRSRPAPLLIGGLPFHPFALLLAFALGALVTLAAPWCPPWRASRVLTARRPAPVPTAGPDARRAAALGDRLVIVVVVVGVVAYPVQRGDASLSGALLAVAILLGGALLAALALQPLGRLVGRPFEWFFGAQGLARPREPRARSGAHRPDDRRPDHRPGVGRGARHRDSVRPRDRRRVGALHPARRLCHSPDRGGSRSIGCGTTWQTITGVDRVMPISEFPAVVGDR